MATQTCRECGRNPTHGEREVCFTCWQRQLDFDDFQKHSYTREELVRIPLRPIIIRRFLFRGMGKTLVITMLFCAGATVGALLLGALGAGVGIVLGVILGLVVTRGLNIMSSETYEPLARRLNSAFLVAAVLCGFVGLCLGIALSQSMDFGKGEERFLAIPIIAVVMALVAVIGATTWCMIVGPKYRHDIVAAFDKWKQKQDS